MVFTRGGGVLLLVVSALLIVSAWAAWLLARLDARHRPVAQGLVAMTACMLAREGLHAYVLHGGPYAGWHRVAFHLEEATRLATAALPAWMALRVLTKWPPGPTAGALGVVYGAAWVGLVARYPEVRADALRQAYLGAELTALFVALLAILSWAPRRLRAVLGIVSPSRAFVGLSPVAPYDGPRWYTYGTVLVLVGGDLVLLIWGAWRWGLFGEAYVVQQGGLVTVWGIVALLQGAALVMARRRA
jgi:hypothetical protein